MKRTRKGTVIRRGELRERLAGSSIHGAGERFTAFLDAVCSASPVTGLTHNFYRYPARFSPQFARKAIEVFTKPGDLVLDPFMGGGTTLVEALALGRRCIGSDLNPLAAFLARVKTTPLSDGDCAVLQKWAEALPEAINLHSKNNSHGEWKLYQRNLPWWLRKTLEMALDSANQLASRRQQRFARCSLMKTAQWALDCRAKIPTKNEFLATHLPHFEGMIASAKALRARLQEAIGKNLSSVMRNRRVILKSAMSIHEDRRVPRHWGPPKLVLTSPPYVGVHILYHRWQVKGRRETPAPYWLAGCPDGNVEAYYTFGSRKRKEMDLYLGFLRDCFSSIRALLNRDSLVVQLVACSTPEIQLPAYLKTMKEVGFEEVEVEGSSAASNRIWRVVPNRKWYAHLKDDLSTGKEFLLIHRKARQY